MKTDWKKIVFGNPFSKKGSSKKEDPYDNSALNDIIYGRPQTDSEASADEKQKELSVKIFESRQEASDVISRELRRSYYTAMFYTIAVRCPNCRTEGVIRLPKGIIADEGECPRCEIEGLQVIGVGSEVESDILNSPMLDEDSETSISEQVQNAVEHAWSIGRIRRGSIFEG